MYVELVIVFGISPVKLPSFRLRIALLSALLASSTLISFGLCSWWLTYQAKVSRLDALLKGILVTPSLQNIRRSEDTSLGASRR